MARITIGGGMGPEKRKTAFLVQLRDIGYNPGLWGVASCTIRAYGLVMHVGVAGNAFAFGL